MFAVWQFNGCTSMRKFKIAVMFVGKTEITGHRPVAKLVDVATFMGLRDGKREAVTEFTRKEERG